MSNKYKILENITTEGITTAGQVFSSLNGKKIYIDYAVPGDVIDVNVISKRSRFIRGQISRLIKGSEYRINPFCEHFSVCGGCKFQNIDYTKQLEFKQNMVRSIFPNYSSLIADMIGSEQTTEYRNKLSYSFTNMRWLTEDDIGIIADGIDKNGLGFHVAGMYHKVLDINRCHLQPEPANTIQRKIKLSAISDRLSFYNIVKFEGDLRHLIIRTTETGQTMVIVIFGTDSKERIDRFMNRISCDLPFITSLYYSINIKMNDSVSDLQFIHHSGTRHITEQLEGCKFSVGPQSFFQPNTRQAEKLYRVIESFAELTGGESILDLYCGVGSIGIYLAKKCKQVVGIEEVPESTELAIQNSQLNDSTNCSFITGKVESSLAALDSRPDLVLVDPPRVGLHKDTVKELIKLGPKKIIYVSCNPASQAKDIQLLNPQYSVAKIQPLDMLPHTPHVESVALLNAYPLNVQ